MKNFGAAIRELAEEKGIGESKVIETIELAIAAAYKKDYGKKGQIVRAKFNPKTGDLHFWQVKIVVDETLIKSEEEIAVEEEARAEALAEAVEAGSPIRRDRDDEEDLSGDGTEIKKVRFNPERHIMLEEAKTTKPDAVVGEEIEFPLEVKHDFGRIASQTAKQVIIQRIREAEREATYDEYKSKEGEIVSGTVQRMEGRNIIVDLGRGVAVLPPEEQLPRERFSIGERVKALLVLVEKEGRGPGMYLSRASRRFIEKLFELEVPEIPALAVEIRAVAREPGSRSKVAVASTDQAVDPVGSMVGQRGVRVSTVMNELSGEKIDIIEWAEDPGRFIGNSLSPAKVVEVSLDEATRTATVVAAEDQLSLAIGKGGQNVRLAAKLTGWKIDVRSTAGPNGTVGTGEPVAGGRAGDAEAAASAVATAAEALSDSEKSAEAPAESSESPTAESASAASITDAVPTSDGDGSASSK